MHFNEDSLATCAPIRKPKTHQFKTKSYRNAALRSLDPMVEIDGRLYWVKLRYEFIAFTKFLKKLGPTAWKDLSGLSSRDWQRFEKREVTKASLNQLNFAILKWSANRRNSDRRQLSRIRVRQQFLHQQLLRSNSDSEKRSRIVLDPQQADAFSKLINKATVSPFWDAPMVNLARIVFWCGDRQSLSRFTTAMNRVPRNEDRFLILLDRAIDWVKSLQKRLATESKLSVTHDFQNNRLQEELHAWLQRKQLPRKLKGNIHSRLEKSIANYQSAKQAYRNRTEFVLPSQVAALSVGVQQGDELLQRPIDRAFAASCTNDSFQYAAFKMIGASSADCFPEAVQFFNQRPQLSNGGNVRRVARQIAEGNRLEDIQFVLEQNVGVGAWDRVRPVRQMLQRFSRIFDARGESSEPSRVFSLTQHQFPTECCDCVLRWLELFPSAVFTRGLCERTFGVLRQLQSLSQVSALREPIEKAMRVWSNRAQQIRNRFDNENEVPQELRPWLRRLTWFQRLAGEPIRLPSSLTKFLAGPKRQQQELEHLAALEQQQGLNHKQFCRLNSLIEKPFNQTLFEKQAIELTMELCVLAAIESLRSLLSNIVRQAWLDVAGYALPSDWSDQRCIEYAEWAASMEPHQTKLLRQTLTAYAYHGPDAKKHLPFNQTWIEKQKRVGYDVDVWLSPRPEQIQIGGKSFRIEISTDPFQLFLMGTIFNTCLSPNDCNDMSMLANTADANKQVIYVRNDCNQIVARKLIAISRENGLLGYNFYKQSSFLDESGCEHLEKEVTSYCQRLANRVGIKLADTGTPIGLGHFWYDDGSVDWSAAN